MVQELEKTGLKSTHPPLGLHDSDLALNHLLYSVSSRPRTQPRLSGLALSTTTSHSRSAGSGDYTVASQLSEDVGRMNLGQGMCIESLVARIMHGIWLQLDTCKTLSGRLWHLAARISIQRLAFSNSH
jgi:hypothetical protein